MSIDWWSIRPLNGRRDKGFEELCSQLARCEIPDGSRFVRKGAPDAGVECYAIVDGETEWAWQAKYFNTLDDSQWSQIDRSVTSAIEKHPKLARYFVCCPLDLPDGRISSRISAADRWARHVEKWERLASDRDMAVQFTYWGSHELLDRLSKPEQAGRVSFWFGALAFDSTWFANRLDEAVSSAGPRYTPELHIHLPIAQEFDAFGRTDRFFDGAIRAIRDLQLEWDTACTYQLSDFHRQLMPEIDAEMRALHTHPEIRTARESIGESITQIVTAGASIEVQAAGTLPFATVAKAIKTTENALVALAELISEKAHVSTATSQYAYSFQSFASKLGKVGTALLEAQRVGDSAPMIVRGEAGTGKTHLLCDVARQRLKANRPTFLLMGQRFTEETDPWAQTMAHLGIDGIRADEFVGALEAAAQAAGARALLMIDALNEGKGPKVWPAHLPAFLARLERSDWIGVVLAIRSSYEEMIPEAVRSRAHLVHHRGFGGQTYNAIRSFFQHYGLSLPSAPFLHPGFDNPLFLKTVCAGLQARGLTELPRGSHGITAILDLYISAINQRLSFSLGFSPRRNLVKDALHDLVAAFPTPTERWLSQEAAARRVDAHLPGRSYEQSLYRALVAEGILVEEQGGRPTAHGLSREIVLVAYDRLADHLLTEKLLRDHLDQDDPEAVFLDGGALAFVLNEDLYAVSGCLEALCVRLPEITRREVPDAVPALAKAEGFEHAFRQSLLWRDVGTFSDRTRELVLQRLRRDREDVPALLHALLTVATIPDHPLNADFLDKRLRVDDMPTRDAWWTVALHNAASTTGSVRRLLDWALAVEQSMTPDEEVVQLSTVSLAWMLTAPDPRVRNAATRALVNLLTGRLPSVARLVDRFSDVDDPYLLERLYAVAYGVATRTHDAHKVGHLAERVYAHVFAANAPPAHILLRDHARGVLDRALHLQSPIDIDVVRIRPPYNSASPSFPSEDDITPLLPDPSHNPNDREGDEWARNQIGHSVLQGRLHRAIRERLTAGEWLSAPLGEPTKPTTGELADSGTREPEPTSFDRGLIERYVLRRVFELGWTTERFGEFDRTRDLDGIGRGGPESFGTKYQWIAFHEVLGLVADHFQYRESNQQGIYSDRYDGPWQLGFRRIDPTCPTTARTGSLWDRGEGHAHAWWTRGRYDAWADRGGKLDDWVRRNDDLPKAQHLLIITHPDDGTRWLNAGSFVVWKQEPPVGRNNFETERGEVSFRVTAYLTRQMDIPPLLEWARTVAIDRTAMLTDFLVDQVFMGEHAWSPAAAYARAQFGHEQWGRLSGHASVWLQPATLQYLRGPNELDPVLRTQWLRFPGEEVIQRTGLFWTGQGADFHDSEGTRVAYDPSAHADGPGMLLLHEEWIREFLAKEELAIVWFLFGTKSVILRRLAPGYPHRRISGAYAWTETGPDGFTRDELINDLPEEAHLR